MYTKLDKARRQYYCSTRLPFIHLAMLLHMPLLLFHQHEMATATSGYTTSSTVLKSKFNIKQFINQACNSKWLFKFSVETHMTREKLCMVIITIPCVVDEYLQRQLFIWRHLATEIKKKKKEACWRSLVGSRIDGDIWRQQVIKFCQKNTVVKNVKNIHSFIFLTRLIPSSDHGGQMKAIPVIFT